MHCCLNGLGAAALGVVLPVVVFGQIHGGEATAVIRSPEDNNHDRSYQGLYGKVRSVITKRKQIETVFGKPKWGKREPSVVSTFDREVRETERLVYAARVRRCSVLSGARTSPVPVSGASEFGQRIYVPAGGSKDHRRIRRCGGILAGAIFGSAA